MRFSAWYKRKKFWAVDCFSGANMWRAYREVKFIAENDNRRSYLLRQQYLKGIIEFALRNTLYYKDKSIRVLSDFPIVNKELLRVHYRDFLCPGDVIPKQKGALQLHATSGSTGTPFQFPIDTQCNVRRIATLKYYNSVLGHNSYEPIVHIRSKHYKGGYLPEGLNNKLNIWYFDNSDLKEQKIRDIISVINTHKVKIIRGYMTSLDFITQYAVANRIVFSHRPTFISVGELLIESLRSRIADDLDCYIVSQYGTEENGILGQSLLNQPGHVIRLNKANCIIEILDLYKDEPVKDGELGRVVITDLMNRAMPMIRFDTGDIAAVNTRDSFGCIESLCHLSGRKMDLIRNVKGEILDFANCLPVEIFSNPSIRQWQFIQKDKTRYVLKLSVRDKSLLEQEMAYIQRIKHILGETADVSIEFTNDFPTLSSGKRKIVVNEYV